MKKTLAFIVALLAALSLVACGGNNDDNNNPTPEKPETKYTINWVDENGNTISSTSVKENEIPTCSYNVTDTAEWDYTLEGWAVSSEGDVLSSIPAATKDATYYAQVSKVKQKYTVVFNTTGGSSIASQTVEYGSKAEQPEAPTYENHKFMGWSYDSEEYEAVDFEAAISSNVEYYAFWNEVVDIKAMLATLLSGYEFNPYTYIPESMRYDYSANLVDVDDIIGDYSQTVDIDDVKYGFGEQWHMVLDNLLQTNAFFDVLSIVETLSATSISVFNNYFDQNPADTAHHEFESGIYNVTISFDGEVLFYVLDYTATLPVFGEQTVQIALAMDAETGEKTVRIQAGEPNALTYKITENSYEFAVKYLGVRRAMFLIERDENGDVSGHIFEYLTVSDVEIASAAEFFITEDYVSVVGNKASGMIGSTSYINELYSTESGKLLGYEVQEKLLGIVYNTLWFNLDDISGINSLKYREKNGDTEAAFFINGSNTAWQAKLVGNDLFKGASRRFDIEFRTQYLYSYDAATEKYTEHTVKVPMLFVQEEHLDTLTSDIYSTNGVTVEVLVENVNLNKILSDYDLLIPVFIENKNTITVDIIIAYIGNKITFEGSK